MRFPRSDFAFPNGGEPAVQRWIENHTRSSDRFAHVADKYEPHRKQHGCYDVHPSSNGPLLGAIAAMAKPRRLLEVGCGLGYSGLWLAFGAGPRALLETIEADSDHAEIARGHFKTEGLQKRIKVLVSEASSVLPALKGPYDLIYFDTRVLIVAAPLDIARGPYRSRPRSAVEADIYVAPNNQIR